jgi:hypothetical protein
MSERRLVVDHMKLVYDGVFDLKEFYNLIYQWLKDKGFDTREQKNQEHVKEGSKYIELELLPWKKITDYARHVIKIVIRIRNMKDTVVEEQDGKRLNMQKANVSITIDGYLDTDYEGRWESKPFYFFIRTFFDKYIYRTYSLQYEELLVENVLQLHSTIKSFLNLFQYEYGAMVRPDMTKL